MQTLIIQGQITATSNKKSELGSEISQRKSLYISLDKENQKKANDFGLTVYTSKDNDEFLIVKASNELTLYKDKEMKKIPSDINSNNFSTNGNVGIAIMKGEKNRNIFYRVYALSVKDYSQIEQTKNVNPFTNEEIENNDDFTTEINDERILF